MRRKIITHYGAGVRPRRPRRTRPAMPAFILLVVVFLGLCGCGTAPEQAVPPQTSPGAAETVTSPEEKPAVSPANADAVRDKTAPARPSGPDADRTAATADDAATADPDDRQPPTDNRTVTLWVTRDFGRETLFAAEVPLPPGSDVLTLLKSQTRVETAYGGKFVNAINGVRSGGRGGRQDWLLWINGLLSPVGAADCRPEPGDIVWWDYRDWSAGPPAPAAVGAFPQPFRRYGCRILYPPAREADARALALDLRTYGIDSQLGPLDEDGVARRRTPTIAVGLWHELADCAPLASLLDRGPRAGAYCRLEPDGIIALGPGGREVTRYGTGSGVVAAAASGPGDLSPLWLAAGVDEDGLARALALFKNGTAFKQCSGLVVTPQGIARLPQELN